MSENAKENWTPIKDNILTKWSDDVDPECPWPEYPRPQFIRDKWLNLNGLWNYAITDKDAQNVNTFDGKILVPYCVESALSGVSKHVTHKDRIWYKRTFTLPETWADNEIMLHFGAVDWECSVWINGLKVGTHSGGFDPFSFNITSNIEFGNKENEIIISVWDPTGKERQERGKQTLRPAGVFYTPISGIWQTVWIEPVPKTRLKSVKYYPDVDHNIIHVDVELINTSLEDLFQVNIESGSENLKKEFPLDSGNDGITKVSASIELEDVKLWSPKSPYLYRIHFILRKNNQEVDSVESYFAMRKISLKKDKKGIPRLALNNEILFQYGPLDQGYWPDGLYTPPTDEALRYDIELAQQMGFNMIRKHIKVEPARWYYHCDTMGMLVWQDMPNGGLTWPGAISGIALRGKLYIPFGRYKKSVQNNYFKELRAMVEHLYNYPCIVVWVPFNEGWGQFKTEQAVSVIRELDTSRLINAASGWIDRGVGDIHDIHAYPGPKMPDLEAERAVANGEFGGLGYIVEDHIWKTNRRKWGYRKFGTSEGLHKKYEQLLEKLQDLIDKGLSAAVYTQTTDVEGEVNGLMTYDRDVVKFDVEYMKELHDSLYDKKSFY